MEDLVLDPELLELMELREYVAELEAKFAESQAVAKEAIRAAHILNARKEHYKSLYLYEKGN